jgi:hypothetical protein
MSKLDIWLTYAAAGIYTLPVIPVEMPDGSISRKNPGSALGKNWPAFSSIDPAQIKQWNKKYPDCGIAGDMARSGLIAFDADYPENVSDQLAEHLANCPAQSTRTHNPQRGHYFSRLRKGQIFRNSTGSLGKNWGEVRCSNGVVILAPSVHEKAAEGGQYAWRRTGTIPYLPTDIADSLATATGSEVPLTNAELRKFRVEHDTEDGGASLDGPVHWFAELIADPTVARHEALVSALCWAFEEAVVGCYSADAAYTALEEVFRASVEAPEAAAAPARLKLPAPARSTSPGRRHTV